MSDNRKIKTLTTVEHIILRKQMYLGSSVLNEYEDWIINDENILSLSEKFEPDIGTHKAV